MDLFEDVTMVRLRSHIDKYLVAGEDQESVFQNRDGSTKNAHWTVEIIEGDHICLKSCYGKYLTASNKPFIPGLRNGRHLRIVQTLPDKLNSSVQWEPVRDGEGDDEFKVILKTRYGNALQANGGPLQWKNSVTHDVRRKSDQIPKKVLWRVEAVENPSDQWREYDSSNIIAKSISYLRNICFEYANARKKKKRKGSDDSVKEGKETKRQQSPLEFFRSYVAII